MFRAVECLVCSPPRPESPVTPTESDRNGHNQIIRSGRTEARERRKRNNNAKRTHKSAPDGKEEKLGNEGATTTKLGKGCSRPEGTSRKNVSLFLSRFDCSRVLNLLFFSLSFFSPPFLPFFSLSHCPTFRSTSRPLSLSLLPFPFLSRCHPLFLPSSPCPPLPPPG